ncbi:hypothetical protein D3C72_1339480 [compost metagenome]
MGDTAPVFRLGEELLAGHLLACESIPQAELGAQAAIAFTRDTAGHERLGVDDLPVLETRLLIRIADLFDEGVLVDRREEAGTLQVGGDDRGNLRTDTIARHEVGDGDRQRLDIALVDVDFHPRKSRCGENRHKGRDSEHQPDRRKYLHVARPFSIHSNSLGSKFTTTSFHASYLSAGRFVNGAERMMAR